MARSLLLAHAALAAVRPPAPALLEAGVGVEEVVRWPKPLSDGVVADLPAATALRRRQLLTPAQLERGQVLLGDAGRFRRKLASIAGMPPLRPGATGSAGGASQLAPLSSRHAPASLPDRSL